MRMMPRAAPSAMRGWGARTRRCSLRRSPKSKEQYKTVTEMKSEPSTSQNFQYVLSTVELFLAFLDSTVD